MYPTKKILKCFVGTQQVCEYDNILTQLLFENHRNTYLDADWNLYIIIHDDLCLYNKLKKKIEMPETSAIQLSGVLHSSTQGIDRFFSRICK